MQLIKGNKTQQIFASSILVDFWLHRVLSFLLSLSLFILCIFLHICSCLPEKIAVDWQVEWGSQLLVSNFLPPLCYFLWPAFGPQRTSGFRGWGQLFTPSMTQAGNKRYWTTAEWQIRRRDGQEKQTVSAILGACGLLGGVRLLSSHPSNHASADMSCFSQYIQFGRILTINQRR